MVARSLRCDESRLRSFLDDELPDDDQAQLSDHLDTCPNCRRALERLAAGSQFWGELPALSPKAGGLHPAAFAPADSAATGTHPQSGRGADRAQALDFLAPSTRPGSLGRLGTYEVAELIGSGGFGMVLKALDPALGRTVAIKVLAPQLATSAAARSRFAREARAAAAVAHEHVVPIYAVESWNGFPYLVMPYISGCSLQETIDSTGPMDVKAVLRIGIQTAQGLAAAHAQGLVHRDVKPSNILLENGVERVRLTDFGLARAVDDASLTQSGVVAGTPQYMSPEQARGEPVDHRSDLFSLGSVLYTMCAGHPPFRAGSTPAVLRRVCDEQPRPLFEVNSDIPRWLAQLIERLHAKDPDGRFQSATEVAALMERYLAALQRGLPIVPVSHERIAPRPGMFRRHAKLAAVLSVSVLALAVLPWAGNNLDLSESFRAIRGALASLAPAGTEARGQDVRVIIGDSPQAERIAGSGVAVVKNWDISNFTSVEIRSAFHARISKGKNFKVATTAEDNVLPFVRVVKEGKTLKIGLDKDKNFEVKERLEAEITLPELVGLDVSGAAQATLTGFDDEKELTLNTSGASHVDGSITVSTASFETSGASSIALSGGAQSAHLSVHGASHLTLPKFLLKECTLDMGGASTAQLAVRSPGAFSAKLSGASHLKGTVAARDLKIELSGASHAKLSGPSQEAKGEKGDPGQSKSSASALDTQTLRPAGDQGASAAVPDKCKTAVIVVSGASHLNLEGLAIETAEVTVSAASHATLTVTGKLSYEASFGAHLRVRGKPAQHSGKKSSGAHVSID